MGRRQGSLLSVEWKSKVRVTKSDTISKRIFVFRCMVEFFVTILLIKFLSS